MLLEGFIDDLIVGTLVLTSNPLQILHEWIGFRTGPF